MVSDQYCLHLGWLYIPENYGIYRDARTWYISCVSSKAIRPARRAGDDYGGVALVRKRDSSRPVLAGPGGVAHLTPRQFDALKLAARGLSSKEIAAYLGISRRSVEDRFDEMRERTGIRTRPALLARAGEAGLVQSAPGILPADLTAGQPDLEGPGQRHSAGDRAKQRTLLPQDAGRDEALDRITACCPELGADAGTRRVPGPATSTGQDEPASTRDLLDALRQVMDQRDRLDRAERALIDMARRRGITWSRIGRALGAGTAQAAQQRRKRLGAEPTRDS